MKSLSVVSLSLASVFSASTLAFDADRLSGELILATGYHSTNSVLSTEGDAKINDLNSNGSHTNDFIVMPLGSISYDLGTQRNHRVYLGTSRDDLAVGDLAFEIGYQYDFANGTQIDIAFLPTVMSGEVWSNPYDTESARTKEDVDGHAYRLKVVNIMNTGLSLDMAYAKSEVDNEGIEYQALHRDSDTYYIKTSYQTMVNQYSGIIASFAYTHRDAEGKAETYDQYKTEATYFMQLDAHSLALTASYAYREYDAINPIFDKVREDDRYKLFLSYEYANFMGWQNWNLVSFAGVNSTVSNINFYESDEYLSTIGLSYRF
ncbi:DUF2860 family protein [Ferrimonas balearica]|uniref:DUF2860 family protein n=1 Tax=Ferrimonas balearica TaxID=44012 RepID=UPI001F3079C0|nr:DUF2860 family protein [Ferrimonas balearica]MBY6095288.1 DUF2860 domain-containing protein [Ferrimonas balearica]